MPTGGIRFCQLSNGIHLQRGAPDNISLTLFPNPSSLILNIQFEVNSVAKALFEVYDMQGRISMAITGKTNIGLNKFTIDLMASNIGTGSYVLHMVLNGVAYDQKFTLIK
jgi:hypothetical protein